MLALSPLAYVGSMAIENALPARNSVAVIGEAEAARIASEFAKSRESTRRAGRPWSAPSPTKSSRSCSARRKPAALAGIVAPTTVRVQLQTDNGNRWFRVTLTPRGKVIGFQERRPKRSRYHRSPPLPIAVAEAAMRDWWGTNPALAFTSARSLEEERQQPGTHLYLARRQSQACRTPRHPSAWTSTAAAYSANAPAFRSVTTSWAKSIRPADG